MKSFIASCAPRPASGVREVGGWKVVAAVGGGGMEEKERMRLMLTSQHVDVDGRLLLETAAGSADENLMLDKLADCGRAQRRVRLDEMHRFTSVVAAAEERENAMVVWQLLKTKQQ